MFRTATVIAMALSFVIALNTPKSRAAEEGVCNAKAKVANLNFTLKDINGKDVALAAHKGNVILLDFWATWCPPCRREIPGFIELYNSYRTKGFIVLGVAMDEELAEVKQFARELKMNYPVLIGYGREDIERAFGPLPLPTAFVIARDGRICGRHTGFTSKEQFEREIEPLL